MQTRGIFTNLTVPDVEAAKEFWTDYLGLSDVEFDLGWVARCTSPDAGVSVQLVSGDATAPEDSVATVVVDDLGEAYAGAVARGFEIVHPVTTEPWGVRRFLVRAPDGNVLNVVQHHR